MKTKQLLRYQSLALVTGLVVLVALWTMPGTAHAQSPTPTPGDLFSSINGPAHLGGGGSINEYTPAGPLLSVVNSTLSVPRGLVFDNAGNLFVASNPIDGSGNFQAIIVKIPAGGGMPSTVASGFDSKVPGANFFLQGLVFDSHGDLFVMAGNNNDPGGASTIYKVTPSGAISPFGQQSGCSQQVLINGSLTSTNVNCSTPSISFGLAFDSAGNLYAADADTPLGAPPNPNPNPTIYRFSPDGTLRTIFAGPNKFPVSPVDSTQKEGPLGLAFDRFGNLFVSAFDSPGNSTILEFAPDGTVITSFTGMPPDCAARGLAFDAAGNLFVAEVGFGSPLGGAIQEFPSVGASPTSSPAPTPITFTSGIGSQTNRGPEYLAFVPQHAIPGNILASINGTTRNGGGFVNQYAPDGTPSTFASGLDRPRGVAFDNAGNFFVATDTFDNSGIHGTIFKITPGGVMSTFATGFPLGFFLGEIALDRAGNVFVDASNSNDPNQPTTIYKVTPDGAVSPFGLQSDCIQSDGSNCSVPGPGPGLAIDSAGSLFAVSVDPTNPTIYKFTGGVRSIFAGPEKFTDFAGEVPAALACDSVGNVFASTNDVSFDTGKGVILEFAPDGTKSIFASGLTHNPKGLAFDGAGNLFVAEIPFDTVPLTGDILEFTPGGTGTVPGIVPPPGFGVTIFASGIGRPEGNGGPEFLVFAPGETPVGSNVVVNTGTAGSAVVAFTFPSVTVGGTTTVTPIDTSSAGTLPTGFDATNALAFDITTTAKFTATTASPIIIAFQVPSSFDVTTLHIFHNEGGTLVDVTASNPAPNPTTHTIYASVTSLSPFVIAKETLKAKIQPPVNANGSSIFSVKQGAVTVKFTLTSNGVPTCQLPPATISLIRTAGAAPGPIPVSNYRLPSDSGSNFRVDSTNCQYVYNLGTGSLGAGTYKVNILIGGTVVGSGTFGLK